MLRTLRINEDDNAEDEVEGHKQTYSEWRVTARVMRVYIMMMLNDGDGEEDDSVAGDGVC